MKRLYYLTNSIASTEKIVADLHQDGVSDWHLHIISRNEAGLYHRHIHTAGLLQQFDLIHLGERGAMIGILTGVSLALIAETIQLFPPFMAHIESVFIIGSMVLFGAWSGGLAGLSRENYRIARFHSDLEKGATLIMVDVHSREAITIRDHIARYHPEASLAGTTSTLTNPFARNPVFRPE